MHFILHIRPGYDTIIVNCQLSIVNSFSWDDFGFLLVPLLFGEYAAAVLKLPIK